MWDKHQFSIILPLYKPKGRWIEKFLKDFNELNNQLPHDVCLKYIVVHDGPADISVISAFDVISKSFANIIFISYPANRGKGYALREGIKIADTPYILMTDFDFPYRNENLTELISLLKKGHDVVAGKRSKAYFARLPFKRKIISRLFILLNRIFLDLPLYDTQSGIKGFNAKGKNVFMETTTDRFLVDTEFILRSYRKNLSIKAFDIELKPDAEFSNFGIQVIKTELRNFLSLLYLTKRLRKDNLIHSRVQTIHEETA